MLSHKNNILYIYTRIEYISFVDYKQNYIYLSTNIQKQSKYPIYKQNTSKISDVLGVKR